MDCDHRYVDVVGPCIGWLEVDGKGQMVTVDSLSECAHCGSERMSVRLEDGSMWIDMGDNE